jgi:hypothetical protein
MLRWMIFREFFAEFFKEDGPGFFSTSPERSTQEE